MKFNVEEILNLSDMKVLDCQEIEGICCYNVLRNPLTIVVAQPVEKILKVYIKIIGE